MITIDELMTAKPFTLSANDTIHDARRFMTEHHIRHIPVTDDNNKLLGLVTQRDILEATHATELESSRGLQLSEIMITDVSTIYQTTAVRQAALFLRSHKYGCLPVVSKDQKLVGIITDSDFIDIAINLLEQVEITEDVEQDIDYEPDDLADVELPVLDDEL